MQPNKKYLAADGYENFMCPMTAFVITQGENVGTHLGTRAVDFASGTAGYRAPYYAPATVKCLWAYPDSGQGIWQTVNKVHCPNGYFGYVTFCTVHDDTFNAYEGMVVPQGEQLGNMGTKGYASGVHLHIEFIQSAYPGWILNQYGIYTFNGTESYVDDTFFVDDTNIITPGAGNWRKCGSAPAPSPNPSGELIEEVGKATFINTVPISVRQDSPNGKVVGKKNKGDVQYYNWKYIGNGHRYIVWEADGHKLYCAVSATENRPAPGSTDQWATFGVVDEQPAPPSPEPTPPAQEFPASVKYKGVDWSEHNRAFDLDGIDFVILRSNWWTTKDKKFEELSAMLEERNIPYGVYCYDYCADERTALEQAKFTYEIIRNKKISCGVWMDMEDADNWKSKNSLLTKEHCTMATKVFCDYFKEKGYYTGVYASSSWFGTYIEELGYPKWVANWGPNDGACHGDFSNMAVMHQYTSNPLDKNVLYINIEDMKSFGNNNNNNNNIPSKPEGEEDEKINNGLINKLLSLLVAFFEKVIGLFK